MKTSISPLPPEQSVADLDHLSWCALIALRLAQHDGKALSPLTIHNFLVSWLASAQKQRRFPRSVAPDIDSLLRLGRQKGPAASLCQRLEYLHESCTSQVKPQSDLFRLTFALEQLKSQGWVNAVVNDGDWNTETLTEEYSDIDALLVRKSALTRGFSDEGKLIAPIEFWGTGDMSVCMNAFQAHSLPATILEPGRIVLQPDV